MGFSLPCLSQSLSFILFLFHFHSTISSPLSSNYSSSSSSHLCAHRQSLSLLQFKQSFSIQSSPFWFARNYQYDQYPKTESWKEGTDCCLWDGVTCDLKTGHVSGLDLSCSMLYGTLHPNNSLFSLHHLQKLDLSLNDFNTSHISSRFGQFSSLTHLNLSGSDLAGQVPSEISHLSKMVSLDLSRNDYVSVEPISFDKLSFDKLVRNLTKLRELDLSWVNMSLVVPDSLMNLSSSLSSLKLDDCGLQGKFPSSMGKFKHLQYLGLGWNNLTGPIPYGFEQLSELVSLHLSGNFYLSLEPISFDKIVQNLTKLRYLALGYLNMSVVAPNSLTNLSSSLSSLSLWGCGLQGKFPGEISSSICKLRFLQVLDLSNNSFRGSTPQCLGNFSNMLSVLHLGMNNLQGTVPSTFSKDNSLEYLNFNGNELEGKISRSIINCTMLQVLDLGNNKIEDTFPYFLETLPKLQILVLKSNTFQGFVKGPTANNSFSKLRILDISDNNFSGPLPTGYFNSLEAMMSSDQNMIYMNATNYTGYVYSIEMTWKGVEIEFTKIRSTIRLGGLTFLAILNLSHNHLEGPIPSGGQFNTFDASSFEGNLGLCGSQVLKKCYGDEAPSLPPSSFDEGDDSTLFGEGFGWKAVTVGYGCGFVFGVATGYVVFRTKMPSWFLRMVEDKWNLQNQKTKKNAGRYGARRN
eukprot:XP_024438519.1 receptor-like protein Cf-9 [Populus trichocarpa]